MNSYDPIYAAIEDFLVQERGKLAEDRSVLNIIFKTLQDEQQICQHIDQNRKADIQSDVVTAEHFGYSTNHAIGTTETEFTGGENETKECRKRQPSHTTDSRKLKEYNSQLEKERLACIFENGPYFLSLNSKTRCKRNKGTTFMRQERYGYISKNAENKENDEPKDHLDIQRTQPSTPDVNEICSRANVRTTVRYGEFSPLNPALIPSSRSLIGLGEYEERRKTFLEKKKHEYLQYLASAKNSRDLLSSRNKRNLRVLRPVDDNDNSAPPSPESPVSQRSSRSCREHFTPDRGLIDGSDICVTKCQQEDYRKALDKQVEEKNKLKKKQENLEKRDCKKCEDCIMTQRKNTMKHIEDEFHRRIDLLNKHENKNQKIDISNGSALQDQTNSLPNLVTGRNNHQSVPELSRHSKSTDRLPSFIGSPIMKMNAESCAIDDVGALQRLQRELYKKELAQQIEEKRRLEDERKAKLKEEEERLEEKVKREEEKLKQDYDREQAELAYRAAQRVQIQERALENLNRIQKETDAAKVKSVPKQLSKPSNIFHTDHKFTDRGGVKNVSFAPKASVYSIHNEIPHRASNPPCTIGGNMPHCKADSIIIEAPYLMAVKDTQTSCDTSVQPSDSKRLDDRARPSSPILPALKTRNLLKSMSKSDEPYIPSAVSMSECTREKYLRSNKIFSNFAQIRRQLMERQSNFHSE